MACSGYGTGFYGDFIILKPPNMLLLSEGKFSKCF